MAKISHSIYKSICKINLGLVCFYCKCNFHDFIQGGSKLERLRDLFEQCLDGILPKFAKGLNQKFFFHFKLAYFLFYFLKAIYLLYAKLEENHGLARRAIKIYERATEAVLPEERYEVF